MKNLATEVPEVDLVKRLIQRLGSDDFELDLQKHLGTREAHLGCGFCYTNNAAVADNIRNLDATLFCGGKIISVIPKMKETQKHDKYQISLEGFSKNLGKRIIEDAFKDKFGLESLNFRLNFEDFPINKISMGTGVIYTSNDRFAE